jgi:hypothetical protein
MLSTKPDQTIKDSPMLETLTSLGQLIITTDGEPNSKTKKLMTNIGNILTKLSDGKQPKYMTPKELLTELPNLTYQELSTEVIWLMSLYN